MSYKILDYVIMTTIIGLFAIAADTILEHLTV